ncbi:MAG: SDR family oxidoreductase [Chitinophagaceae bacterium]|nr:SDR family oxidoreductase [Oligoflexus sp.]
MNNTGDLAKGTWALILGGSSGIGLASAKKLAAHGFNLCVVHRDRRGSMAEVEKDFDEIRAHGGRLVTFNCDALTSATRALILDSIAKEAGAASLGLVLHSIALGNMRPVADLNEDDFAQTIANMGTNLLFWVQDLHRRNLFKADARVLGLTSEGNSIAWEGYAAISAAKSALEAVARSVAVAYAQYGIRCNILQPGITDTKALRLIPGADEMKARALKRNPFQRLTTPEDIAGMVYLMSRPEAAWINGSIIRVDGGEAISN